MTLMKFYAKCIRRPQYHRRFPGLNCIPHSTVCLWHFAIHTQKQPRDNSLKLKQATKTKLLILGSSSLSANNIRFCCLFDGRVMKKAPEKLLFCEQESFLVMVTVWYLAKPACWLAEKWRRGNYWTMGNILRLMNFLTSVSQAQADSFWSKLL